MCKLDKADFNDGVLQQIYRLRFELTTAIVSKHKDRLTKQIDALYEFISA